MNTHIKIFDTSPPLEGPKTPNFGTMQIIFLTQGDSEITIELKWRDSILF